MQTSTLWTIPPQYSLPVESHWHNGKKARRQYTLASVAYPLTRRERNYIEFDRIFVLKVLSYSDIIVDSIAKKRAMVSNKGPDCALRSNSSAINSCRGNTGGLMACPGDTHRRGPAETSMKPQRNFNTTSTQPQSSQPPPSERISATVVTAWLPRSWAALRSTPARLRWASSRSR
jgi:hypothetical protein